ncbi:Pentatricopeptide repeat-containing protein [Dorcoceras hygrometricum]|uniref:Pentatricopeptide repeat-containing protein n=1 Tax=Dorcoceras hygrometricum TaxID=472368 RepID=A0A2Z7ATZ1_9LAMI|nr:Pentatricopeptide repeat-containing protein [Dorcoceras hygrometricum]
MHSQSAGENHRSVIFRSVDHHSSVVFKHDNSAGHHPMIALDLSGVTTQPTDHNSSSTRVINQSSGSIFAFVMVAAGSRRTIVRVIEEATRVWFGEPVADEKRRRLVKWKRCVLGIASGTSSEGSVALFIQSREISVVSWWSAAASFCLVGTVSFWMFLENSTTGCC